MGFYERQVLPRILNVACGTKMAGPLRRRVCDGLAGDVVEIGFGSGLKWCLRRTGSDVTHVTCVYPLVAALLSSEPRP